MVAQDYDVCEAIRTGLERRPDLSLLRHMQRDLNYHTLSVVQHMLGGFNVLLGGPPTPQRAVEFVMGRRSRRPSGGSRIAKTALLTGQRRSAVITPVRFRCSTRRRTRRRRRWCVNSMLIKSEHW